MSHVCHFCVHVLACMCIPRDPCLWMPTCFLCLYVWSCVWAVRGCWNEGEPDESSEVLCLPHGCSRSCSPRTGNWESSRDWGDWARGQDAPLPGEVKEHMSSLLGITYMSKMGFTASCFSLTRFGTKEPDSPSLVCTGQEFSPCCNLGNSCYSYRY